MLVANDLLRARVYDACHRTYFNTPINLIQMSAMVECFRHAQHDMGCVVRGIKEHLKSDCRDPSCSAAAELQAVEYRLGVLGELLGSLATAYAQQHERLELRVANELGIPLTEDKT